MKARVTVTLKTGILDPQGKAIEGALKSLGVDGVASVRQGKVFDIELSGADKAKAEAALKDAADKLLANTVIENYRVEVLSYRDDCGRRGQPRAHSHPTRRKRQYNPAQASSISPITMK